MKYILFILMLTLSFDSNATKFYFDMENLRLYVMGHMNEKEFTQQSIAMTIWAESRQDGLLGMRTVADVIRNRVKSPKFPNTYEEVIFQRNQFSCWKANGGLKPQKVSREDFILLKKAYEIAKQTLEDKLPKMTSNAMFYHTESVKPIWRHKLVYLGKVGSHRFYTQ